MVLLFCSPKGTSFLCFLIISSYLQLLSHVPTTAAGPIRANCTGGLYAANTTFQANLKTLLSSLAHHSSSSNSANVTSGKGAGPAYGVYLCEGDLTSYDCQACILTATTDIIQSCPSARQAIVWYDYCLLRYSNSNFFGVPDAIGYNLTNPFQINTSPVPFQAVANLVQVAPFSPPLMFATNVSVSDGLYAMAQCTADLSSDGCSRCLTTILADIKACCTGSDGWRYLAASCWIRYESNSFFKNLNGTSNLEIIQHQCSNQSFPPASLGTVEASLNSLLSAVTSNASTTGFYNTTAGEGSARLYGLALCRAELSTPVDNCTNCLTEANSTITGPSDCANKTQGIKWYEKCLLRYSDQNFFGVVDDGQGAFRCGPQPVTEEISNATLASASRLVEEAANNPLKFAAGQARASDSQWSYILLQCTRDLSGVGCNNCLQKGMGVVASSCKNVKGWRYLSGSCTIRYEDWPFFNTSVITIASSGPPVPQPTLPAEEDRGNSHVAQIVAPILEVTLLGLLLYYLWWRLKRRHDRRRVELEGSRPQYSSKDLPFIGLPTIQAATCNFSDANKLGEGGFGPVYKGTLHGGREIAVKRLSSKSKQGAAEFKTEVSLIAKLQHKNLVRMLGYCVERGEKLLVYEYLPNRSLDVILFDPTERSQLDWRRRRHIVAGIARGILYLHQDSLLKVIHRDLKASNVLLDRDMNPKISDFGMAKIFEADENEATNSSRVVGTYGYMAPEYAMDGVFSVKSDVYSFGVLLLEILSGQKNGRAHFEQHGRTLLRSAWQLWSEGQAMQLVDPQLGDSYPASEALKIIHIGLLCVQDNAEERPTMSSIVHMLQSDQKMPQPTQPPTFSLGERPVLVLVPHLSSSATKTHSTNSQSINEVTDSGVVAR